jgi:hypothetical protein
VLCWHSKHTRPKTMPIAMMPAARLTAQLPRCSAASSHRGGRRHSKCCSRTCPQSARSAVPSTACSPCSTETMGTFQPSHPAAKLIVPCAATSPAVLILGMLPALLTWSTPRKDKSPPCRPPVAAQGCAGRHPKGPSPGSGARSRATPRAEPAANIYCSVKSAARAAVVSLVS